MPHPILLIALSLFLTTSCTCPCNDPAHISKVELRREQIQSFLERLTVAAATDQPVHSYFTDNAKVVFFDTNDDGQVSVTRTDPEGFAGAIQEACRQVTEYEFEITGLSVTQTDPGWDVNYTVDERFGSDEEEALNQSTVDLELVHSENGARIGRMSIHR